MEHKESGAGQTLRKKRACRKRIRAVLALLGVSMICALAACVVVPVTQKTQEDKTVQAEDLTAQAAIGTIQKTVFGSGEVQPLSQPGVYAETDGKAGSVLVEVGDSVKAGDIVMRLQNDELDAQISQLEYDVQTAQAAVEDTETHTQYVYKQLYDEDGDPRFDVNTDGPLLGKFSNEVTISAPVSGVIKAIYVKEGDDALAVYREKGAVMVISTDGRMKVELSGLPGDLLELGQSVSVKGRNVDATGTVVSLTRRGTEATIQIDTDEYAIDVPVAVYTLDGETVGEGTLELNKPMAVSAYGGTIKGLTVKVGDTCEREDVLARLVWDEMPLYLDNASVLRNYEKTLAELETVYQKRDALTIAAPCDGMISGVEVQAGDEVRSGVKLLTIVEAGTEMTLTLAVDELDILSVEPGQTVELSIDALPDAELTGTVQKIAPLGNTEGTVTTYDVTVALNESDERVKGGMNVSGNIVVKTVENALTVPTDALKKDENGYYVMMESGQIRHVSIGVMTEEQTQIVSGLSEEETVAY